MKIIILFLVITNIALPQDIGSTFELLFGTEQATDSINFTINKQSQVWGIDSPTCESMTNNDFYLTSDYNDLSYKAPANQSLGNWKGLDFVTSQNNGMQVISYGLYKISVSESDSYFYIDYRDGNIECTDIYKDIPPAGLGHHLDIWVKYNANSNSFFYSNNGNLFIGITHGSLLEFWTIKNVSEPNTKLFPSYWSHALAVISSVDNHPLLVWGPYPVDDNFSQVHYYSISRKNGSLDWEEDFASTTQCYYEDDDFTLTGAYSHTVQYKVRAVKTALPNNLYSGYTNTESITVSGVDPGKKIADATNFRSLEIYQNYPNPFNPLTNINYQINDNSFVNLRVYNAMGEEVAVLVNEQKTPGSYSVQFNAYNLSSGVYFYKLTTGQNTLTKSMILSK